MFFTRLFLPPEKPNKKKKEKKITGETAGDRNLLCVYKSKQHIAQGQKKSTLLPGGERQAKPWEAAFMLVPDLLGTGF